MLPPLPAEITDRIIDCISEEDGESLCNCALTCRTWLARSRYRLFSDFFIHSRHSLDCAVRELRSSHLYPLFDSVKRLYLYEDYEKPWVHLVPFKLTSLLPQIEQLVISLVDRSVVQPHPSTLTVGFPLFTSVDTLYLTNCQFGSFRDLQRLLVSLPRLRILSMNDVAWKTGPPADATPESLARGLDKSRPLLSSLSLKFQRDILLDWLIGTRCITSIERLEITDRYETCGRFITSLGGTLQDLILQLDHADSLAYIDLSNNSSLRTLELQYGSDIANIVPTLLSRVSVHSRMHTVTFQFDFYEQPDLHQLESSWRRITDILLRDHFCDLQTIIIRVSSTRSHREEVAAMGQQMPSIFAELHQRGVSVTV